MRSPLPRLSRPLLDALPDGLVSDAAAARPVRVVQFGTGALLRGLVGDLVDEANRAGRFDGSIAMVGQTGSGRSDALAAQSGLYTLGIRGLDADGRPLERYRVVAATAFALDARTEWDAVLALARRQEVQSVVSNTTEAGLRFSPDDRSGALPPVSFPAKLTAFLYERARTFGFEPAFGVVVLPLELVEHNGPLLRRLVRELSERWELDARFGPWLDAGCRFPATLLDRIVPGTPPPDEHAALEARLGYRDALLTLAEPFRFLAIEGDETLRSRVQWLEAAGVEVVPDIGPYRLRKVYILNGAHTAMAPLALLCGLQTVGEAVQDEALGAFTRRLIFEEIVPVLALDRRPTERFAQDVLRRFANPFVHHALRSITLQQTAKVRVRLVPTLLDHAERGTQPPPALSLAFAAYLHSLRPGQIEGLEADDEAAPLVDRWRALDHVPKPEAQVRFVGDVLGRADLWGHDLTRLLGFAEAVSENLTRLVGEGPRAALARLLSGAGARAHVGSILA
ncbi:MAG TPA: tagaturonate reductase [Rhodothermales bacterium]|nr:tagaturonate reductase [Rhodothermales bacterium]